MLIKLGSIVKSAAGHDKNRFYMVTAIEDSFVYIADGRERKLLKPKKKNIKHVDVTSMVLDINTVETDKKLRELLKSKMKSDENSEFIKGR